MTVNPVFRRDPIIPAYIAYATPLSSVVDNHEQLELVASNTYTEVYIACHGCCMCLHCCHADRGRRSNLATAGLLVLATITTCTRDLGL